MLLTCIICCRLSMTDIGGFSCPSGGCGVERMQHILPGTEQVLLRDLPCVCVFSCECDCVCVCEREGVSVGGFEECVCAGGQNCKMSKTECTHTHQHTDEMHCVPASEAHGCLF